MFYMRHLSKTFHIHDSVKTSTETAPHCKYLRFQNGTRDLRFEPSHGASEIAHYSTNLHKRKTLIHTLHCV